MLGVDPSLSHTALVLGVIDPSSTNPTEVQSYRIKLDGAKFEHTIARLAALRERLTAILEAVEEDYGGPGVLIVEGYGFGIKNSHSHSLGEWGGQVRLAAYHRGWLLVIANIATIKKFTSGKGNAEKDQMMMEILDRWQYKATDNNNADAYALMRLGLVFVARVGEREVLKKDIESLKKLEVCLPHGPYEAN